MKAKTFAHLAAGAILAAAACVSTAQVGVSLSVGVPGFYGAIDIGGGVARPALVYSQPMLIGPAVMGVAPLYLYVPPEQYNDWGSYCGYYDACNRPVYFVQPSWYQRVYVPYYHRHRNYYMGRRMEFDRHIYRQPDRVMHRPGPGPMQRPEPVQRPGDHRPPVAMERPHGREPMAHPDNNRHQHGRGDHERR